jgi:TonB-linked SusC/RagA family outer membrane protein
VKDSASVLIFSFVGYVEQEIKVGRSTRIDIRMTEDVMRLDDVVVIGYGTAKKSDLTGAIASVKPKDLNASGVSNAAQMLQGRVTGLYINSHDQNPGATPDFVLRGASSFQSGEAGQPLIVIDGFPMESTSSINTINPNDIEQIDVLKDASATAIYGSRGANGVIIITTKQGNQKGLQVDYSSRFFTQTQARRIDVMDGQEYARFYYDLAHDPNLQIGTWGPENGYPHPFSAWDTLANTDWQNEVLNTRNFSQEHNLSLSGVREGVKYRAATSYYDAKGIIAPTGYKRLNALARLDYEFKKFSFNLDFNFTNELKNNTSNSYERAVGFSPSTPVYDADGNLSQHAFESIRSWYYNPLFPGEAEENFREINSTRIAAGMSYEILPGLRASVKGGFNQSNEENFYQRFEPFYPSQTETEAYLSSYSNRQLYAEGFLNYTKQFESHKILVMAGGTYQNYRRRGLWSSAMDFPYKNIGYYNIDAGLLEREMGSSWYEKRQVSGLVRINYDYRNRYLITVNYRLDGATVFGDNSKWGHFPSFGVAYRIDQEEFFRDAVPFLSALKLKAGYGIAGNSNIPSFRTQNLIDFNPVHEGNGITNGILWVSPVNREEDSQRTTFLPNPDLHWETTYTFNTGVDIGNSKFYAEINYYRTNHDQLILDRQVPAETGFNYITVNKGAMTNQGVEAKVDLFLDFFNNQIQWRPSILLSYNKNVITDLNNDEILGFAVWIDRTLYGYAGIKQEGYPLNAVWGYDFIGIWQADEIEEAAQYGAEPGDPKFADIHGIDENGNSTDGPDGQITEEDKVFLGDANPEFTAGLTNQFNYKNWELSFFFEGVFNKTVVNIGKATLVYPSYNYGTNKMRMALDRWTTTNPSNKVPSLTTAIP